MGVHVDRTIVQFFFVLVLIFMILFRAWFMKKNVKMQIQATRCKLYFLIHFFVTIFVVLVLFLQQNLVGFLSCTCCVLFLFFLFCDLDLELSMPLFWSWFRKSYRFGCFVPVIVIT
jgi:cell division protein FtsW (lipid II flippase)